MCKILHVVLTVFSSGGDESASMRACLIQCLDAGVNALANAGNFFDAIASESRPVKETVSVLVHAS
jgi:hypothetical protein